MALTPTMHDKIAIFFDRDGTLIIDKGYIKYPSDVELLNDVKQAVSMLLKKKCILFLFSNQSGVLRGLMTINDVNMCNARMLELIGDGDIFLESCIATELPGSTDGYRKPSPRFIIEMIDKYDLSKKNCYMVGDKECDVLAGENAGINPVLIADKNHQGCAGFPHEILDTHRNIKIFPSVYEFAKDLVGRVG